MSSQAVSASDENKYSRMRQLPVLISARTVMPGLMGKGLAVNHELGLVLRDGKGGSYRL